MTLEQLREMMELQEQLEIRIGGSDWRNAGHDYALCVHMECAELIEAYGWKHWKHHEPDYDKMAMEVIDIWHFVMAFLLEHNGDEHLDEFLHMILTAADQYDPDTDLVTAAVGMSFLMFTAKQVPFGNFITLMAKCNMNFDQLYKLYISKNVLNWFRQEHGYKEGTYIKVWAGREDNEHLQELMEQLGDALNAVTLNDALKRRYNMVTY
jgi:dimeric dUTPase (all-alpha-NTP-PPase superfamily)